MEPLIYPGSQYHQPKYGPKPDQAESAKDAKQEDPEKALSEPADENEDVQNKPDESAGSNKALRNTADETNDKYEDILETVTCKKDHNAETPSGEEPQDMPQEQVAILNEQSGMQHMPTMESSQESNIKIETPGLPFQDATNSPEPHEHTSSKELSNNENKYASEFTALSDAEQGNKLLIENKILQPDALEKMSSMSCHISQEAL